MRWRWVVLGAAVLALVIASLQITVFVVQPIGTVPEGRTAILWRRSSILRFVDSADAICLREHGGVSLLCRGMTLAGVVENNPILLRLPYSDTLYAWTTGGQRFDR